MTMRCGAVVASALLAMSLCGSAAAQSTGQRGANRARGSGEGVAAPTQQGFSVVLVVADLQGTTSQDDVPPAARRALAEMKDFLPYKTYRLVDAAWILGQRYSRSISRMRGPDNQDYELKLESAPTASGVSVRFTLSDGMTLPPRSASSTVAGRSSWMAEQERLKLQLAEAKRAGQRDRVKVLEERILELEQAAETARTRTTKLRPDQPSHPLIDTSFTMQIGETVVVGTSRLRENSRALIALLTAVPGRIGRGEVSR